MTVELISDRNELREDEDGFLKGKYKVVGDAEGIARLILTPVTKQYENVEAFLSDVDRFRTISNSTYFQSYRELLIELFGFVPDQDIQIRFSHGVFAFTDVVTPRIERNEVRPIHQTYAATAGWREGPRGQLSLREYPYLIPCASLTQAVQQLASMHFTFSDTDAQQYNDSLRQLGAAAGKP